MLYLGIEGTAHTLGVSLVEEKGNKISVLSNERDMFVPKEGLIPREVADHHVDVYKSVLKKAFEKGRKRMEDVDFIVYSKGPGLPPVLRVTFIIAKSLSEKYNVPLAGVNHASAHISVAKYFCGFKDVLALYVSGGNTQIVSENDGRYFVVGESLDIALGNAYDKLARHMGFSFPGGPKIEEYAKKGRYIELPYTIKGMDFSFSGITTEAQRRYDKGYSKEDICFSFQENVLSVLTEAIERALAHTGKKELVLCGGVASNRRFNEMINIMAKDRNVLFKQIPKEYAGDNGAMIALEYIMNKDRYDVYDSGEVVEESVLQRWRLDEL